MTDIKTILEDFQAVQEGQIDSKRRKIIEDDASMFMEIFYELDLSDRFCTMDVYFDEDDDEDDAYVEAVRIWKKAAIKAATSAIKDMQE